MASPPRIVHAKKPRRNRPRKPAKEVPLASVVVTYRKPRRRPEAAQEGDPEVSPELRDFFARMIKPRG